MNRSWLRTGLQGGIIILVTVLAYSPALRGGFVWDDDAYVTENQTLRSAEGLRRIWFEFGATPQYYPLVFTTFWTEYHLWRLDPFGYHLVNVVLHAIGAIILWRVLRRLSVPGSWLAAAVFALHPVNVESVAWITERKNVLSGVFYLSALLAYLRFIGVPAHGPDTPRRWCHYGLALVLFSCALWSKTVTCSLPAAILLLLWFRKPRLRRADVLPLVPMFLAGAVMGLLTAWLERHHVRAGGDEWALSLADRGLIAGRAVWFYLAKLVWPTQLTFIYPRWRIDASVWWQYLPPLTALVAVVLLWVLRKRIGRGPLVAALFFGVTLAPALSFINVYPMRFSFVADHFQHLACIGPITLAAAVLTAVLRRPGDERRDSGEVAGKVGNRRLRVVLPSALIPAVLGALTWKQAANYTDAETLWRDTLDKNPSAWIAHNNLGGHLNNQGRFSEAMLHFSEALRLNPGYPKAHNNLGVALAGMSRLDEAITHYNTALEHRPNYLEAHYNLANATFRKAELDNAVIHYRQALKLGSDDPRVRTGLANTLWRRGERDEALIHYVRTVELVPDDAGAHHRLANALAATGSTEQAIDHYRAAVQLDPGDVQARYDLGSALVFASRLEEAVAHFRAALALRPDYAEAHNNLGFALARLGKLDDAIGHYRAALRLRSDFALAHKNLGTALANRGEMGAAARALRQAVELRPDDAEAHYRLGLVLSKSGRNAEALSEYREALRLDPHHTGARERLDDVE